MNKDNNDSGHMNKDNNDSGISYALYSTYRGVLMGLSMLSIILFHYCEDCCTDQYHYNAVIRFFHTYFGSSAVDIFLLLSGFGLYYSAKRNRDFSFRHYYVHRLAKVLVPYFIVAIPALIWRDVIIESRSFFYAIGDLFFAYFFISGRRFYWYILAISICYIMFPYFFNIIDSASDDITAQMRTILMYCLSSLICLLFYLFLKDSYDKLEALMLRIFPFIFGVYLGRLGFQHNPIKLQTYLFASLSIPIMFLRKGAPIFMVRNMQFFLSLFVTMLVILAFYVFHGFGKIGSALNWIGKYTLEIYLCHVTVRAVMTIKGYHLSSIKLELLQICIAAVLSAILHIVVAWIYKVVPSQV